MLILSGASGTGKTTAARRLLDRHAGPGGRLVRSVSVTTRPGRAAEVDGEVYAFVTPTCFAALRSKRQLLEHAELYGHRYGTPRAFVEDCLRRGVDVLLVLDACGRRQLAASHGADLVSVFLLPPSPGALEARLRGRGDGDETVARRLAATADEISRAADYDYVLVNRGLDATVESLDTILRAERLRRERPVLPIDGLSGDTASGY